MKTTAYLVEEPGGDFVAAEVELEEPRDDEVLVRIVATGLCHTDLTVPTIRTSTSSSRGSSSSTSATTKSPPGSSTR